MVTFSVFLCRQSFFRMWRLIPGLIQGSLYRVEDFRCGMKSSIALIKVDLKCDQLSSTEMFCGLEAKNSAVE